MCVLETGQEDVALAVDLLVKCAGLRRTHISDPVPVYMDITFDDILVPEHCDDPGIIKSFCHITPFPGAVLLHICLTFSQLTIHFPVYSFIS